LCQASVPEGCSASDGLESEANLQQPSGSTTPPVINPVLNWSATETNSSKPLGSTTPPVIDSALNQFGRANADVEMTTLTTSVTTQPRHSGSVQRSTTYREPQPQILISTNNNDLSSVDLGLSQHTGSVSDTTEQSDSEAKDQELEDLNSALVTLAASLEYLYTNRQILLNIEMLLNTLDYIDVRDRDKQPDETEEQYQIYITEENKVLAELENQKLVTLGFILFLSILTII
jgi:hypothetical protein